MKRVSTLNESGATSRGSMVAVAILVVALATVVILWMNDRESADASLDIDIGTAPALESALEWRSV